MNARLARAPQGFAAEQVLRRVAQRSRRGNAVVGSIALAIVAFFSGCNSGDEGCDNSQCAAKSVCVQGGCRPPCTGQQDCPLSYNCADVIADDGKTQGLYCVRLPYAENGSTGQNVACTSNDQCDALRGFTCKHDTCRFWCSSDDDCGPAGICVQQEGLPERVCQSFQGDFAPGHFNTRCPIGNECDTAAGFFCHTQAKLDAGAYCTKTGCSADSDCAPGYACIDELVGRVPCEDACGLTGDPTTQDCIHAAEIGGGTWSCGPTFFNALGNALERRTCVKRSYCMACETDIDCGGLPNQVCAKDASGSKICTTLCDPSVVSGGCPWSFASECKIFDSDLGVPTCGHRFGSCHGTKPCEPCIQDKECEGADGYCETYTSGERACVDGSLTCTTRTDCPQSPSGLQMECSSFGSSSYGICDFAYSIIDLTSTKLGCWPQP